jgi:hypothetical protein
MFVAGAFVLWIASVGPIRSWATGAGIRDHWAFGVAPSFFAGSTLTAWQTASVGTRPAFSVLFAGGLLALAEVAHLFMPHHTADGWDVLAGLAGALVAFPYVQGRTNRRRL